MYGCSGEGWPCQQAALNKWDINTAHTPHVVVGLLGVGDLVGVGGGRLGVGVGVSGVAGAARRCFVALVLALGVAAGLVAVALFLQRTRGRYRQVGCCAEFPDR